MVGLLGMAKTGGQLVNCVRCIDGTGARRFGSAWCRFGQEWPTGAVSIGRTIGGRHVRGVRAPTAFVGCCACIGPSKSGGNVDGGRRTGFAGWWAKIRRNSAKLWTNFKVPSVDTRRTAVEAVLARCERKARELPMDRNKVSFSQSFWSENIQHRRRKSEPVNWTPNWSFCAECVPNWLDFHNCHPRPIVFVPNAFRHLLLPCILSIAHWKRPPLPSAQQRLFVPGVGQLLRIVLVHFPIVTVEWSTCPDFSTLSGTKEVADLRTGRVIVENLPLGGIFAFRVSTASIWGWSTPVPGNPPLLRVSSWSELEEANGQQTGRLDPRELAELVEQVERHRQGPIWQRSGQIFEKRFVGFFFQSFPKLFTGGA